MNTLVFSHANSYPAAVYQRLFRHWEAAGWRVAAMPKFGHDRRFPVGPNWPRLVDELALFINTEVRPDGPVALVGHSLGGLLSLMLAARQPALARCVVQLDSPFIAGWRRALVRSMQVSGLVWRLPPASIARQRREHWPDAAAVRAHFLAKPMFQAWHPQVFDDFVAHGFEPDPERGGLRLAFRRGVEARIYAGLPHALPRFARSLQAPVGFVAGTRSAEMRQGGLAATRAFIGATHWREVEGSHLFPMERPDETASTVLGLLSALGENPRG